MTVLLICPANLRNGSVLFNIGLRAYATGGGDITYQGAVIACRAPPAASLGHRE
jgi:hypothetical protein